MVYNNVCLVLIGLGDDDLGAIAAALEAAQKVHDRPSFIKVR
jgi:hypothetical protein